MEQPPHDHTAEEELFVAKIDRIMAEESIILAGLKEAVRAGRITEDEKHIWLDAYIDKRNESLERNVDD